MRISTLNNRKYKRSFSNGLYINYRNNLVGKESSVINIGIFGFLIFIWF